MTASPNLVLIGGTGRSGSTLLGLMLGSAEGAFYLGEVAARYRPWRRHHFVLECRGCGGVCETWERLRDLPERGLHRGVARRLGVRHVVDSSKYLPWIWDSDRRARRQGLAVHHVAIWKEPEDLAYSIWKRGGPIGRWERVFASYYRRYFELGLPFVATSYRRLASEPEASLAALCAAVGVPYRPEMLRFWEQPHHHLFASANVRVGGGRPIRPTRLPPVFRDLWADQPPPRPATARLIEELRAREAADGAGPRAAAPARRLPPRWYFKARAVRAFQRFRPETWEPPSYRLEALAEPEDGATEAASGGGGVSCGP